MVIFVWFRFFDIEVEYDKKRTIIIGALCLVICITMIIMLLNGVIKLNNPSNEKYPIRGVDVSEYQGEIDWKTLSKQDIQFAFIKATEGSSYVDEYFKANWENAQKTKLAIGAYHFFSFDSGGKTQAENFINNVSKTKNMLIPVIDVEYYKSENNDREEIKKELKIMADELEAYYGKNPIIYTTQSAYKDFIIDDFTNNPIWIRDVIKEPELPDGREWTFWQYSDKGNLKGYKGVEKYIDLNVFNGNNKKLKEFLVDF